MTKILCVGGPWDGKRPALVKDLKYLLVTSLGKESGTYENSTYVLEEIAGDGALILSFWRFEDLSINDAIQHVFNSYSPSPEGLCEGGGGGSAGNPTWQHGSVCGVGQPLDGAQPVDVVGEMVAMPIPVVREGFGFDPVTSPGMTDLMVTPEEIDKFLKENLPPKYCVGDWVYFQGSPFEVKKVNGEYVLVEWISNGRLQWIHQDEVSEVLEDEDE